MVFRTRTTEVYELLSTKTDQRFAQCLNDVACFVLHSLPSNSFHFMCCLCALLNHWLFLSTELTFFIEWSIIIPRFLPGVEITYSELIIIYVKSAFSPLRMIVASLSTLNFFWCFITESLSIVKSFAANLS